MNRNLNSSQYNDSMRSGGYTVHELGYEQQLLTEQLTENRSTGVYRCVVTTGIWNTLIAERSDGGVNTSY